MIVSLSRIKAELSEDWTDTREDEFIERYLSHASDIVRNRTHREIHWKIQKFNQVNSKLWCRCHAHGLSTGDTVKVTGTTVDGEHTLEVVDANTLYIPEDPGALSTSELEGVLHVQRVADMPIHDANTIYIPQQYVPAESVILLQVWNNGQWETVHADDYTWEQTRDGKTAKIVWTSDGETVYTADSANPAPLYQPGLGNGFPVRFEYPRGQYGLRRQSRRKDARLTYWAGLPRPPYELEMAAESIALDLWERSGGPKDLASASEEGVTSQKLTAEERRQAVLSSQQVIDNWAVR